MKTLRYLAGRLPWLVLGVGIGAAAVWLTRDRHENPGPPASRNHPCRDCSRPAPVAGRR